MALRVDRFGGLRLLEGWERAPLTPEYVGARAREYGVAKLAEETGFSRAHLYRCFRVGGNPRLKTLWAVLKVMNIGVAIEPAARALKSKDVAPQEVGEENPFEAWWSGYMGGREINPFPDKAALWNAKQAAWSAWNAALLNPSTSSAPRATEEK